MDGMSSCLNIEEAIVRDNGFAEFFYGKSFGLVIVQGESPIIYLPIHLHFKSGISNQCINCDLAVGQ